LSLPIVLMPAMCMEINTDPDMGNIISTFLFVGGIITILQTTFGTRLPIVQGGSFAFVIPALAVLNTNRWKCPAKVASLPQSEQTHIWQERMREIQGAIIMASIFQICLGLFGNQNLHILNCKVLVHEFTTFYERL
jgi:nucleobase transporter 1/2